LSTVSEWRVGCIAIVRQESRNKDLDELRIPKNGGEPMSQGSNWNPIHRYEESLHSSEVFDARELKFCEGCGVLLLRLRGSKAQFCPGCEAPAAIAMGRMR